MRRLVTDVVVRRTKFSEELVLPKKSRKSRAIRSMAAGVTERTRKRNYWSMSACGDGVREENFRNIPKYGFSLIIFNFDKLFGNTVFLPRVNIEKRILGKVWDRKRIGNG